MDLVEIYVNRKYPLSLERLATRLPGLVSIQANRDDTDGACRRAQPSRRCFERLATGSIPGAGRLLQGTFLWFSFFLGGPGEGKYTEIEIHLIPVGHSFSMSGIRGRQHCSLIRYR